MAKKLPEGWSIKTEPEEINLVEMYYWVVYKDGKEQARSFLKFDERIDARRSGEKKLWELYED